MLRPAVSFCLFVSFAHAPAEAAADGLLIREAWSGVRGGQALRVHSPAAARDPFLRDAAPPARVVQAYFAELPALEAAVPALEQALGPQASCEAMAVRRFAVPQPAPGGCSYLVAYAGPADDPRAWHAHYLEHHAPLMAGLPGIRELEVYLPVDWRNRSSGWQPVRSLQRNKVAFDSPAALEAALGSPLRAKMRADFAAFPPYRGAVTHYPMLTFDPWKTT
jgi:uncharacterized protein (TIGR02118 family)